MLLQTILFIERMCKEYKRQRSTILYGAGASIPFYDPPLTTKYLTDKVLDSRTWGKILDKHKCAMQSGYDVPSATVILEVLYKIKNIYETHANGKKIDFEQLAEIIDKISSIEYDFAPESNMLNLFLHTIGAKPMGLPFWKHIPFLFREVIAKTIIDIEKKRTTKAKNYDKLQKRQQEFIKRVMSNGRNVSVISLNYDECVPKSIDKIAGFDYCFSSVPNMVGNRLNVKQFLSAPNVVYFPHGHLRFYRDLCDKVSYATIDEAEVKRWDTIAEHHCEQTNPSPFAYDFNTFITTGQTKDNAFNITPFDVYYQRLANDFAESNTLYVIGYSFGDSHIDRLIHGFLKRDDKNKVFVIDKYDEEITMIDEYRDSSNILTKINATLLAEWRVFLANNTTQLRPYENEVIEGVNNVNKIGYGTVFKQVVFYRKGYESFLNEYEAVITEVYHNPRCRIIQGCIDKVKDMIRSCNKYP